MNQKSHRVPCRSVLVELKVRKRRRDRHSQTQVFLPLCNPPSIVHCDVGLNRGLNSIFLYMVSVKVPFAVRVPEVDVFASALKLQLAKDFPALVQSRKSCNDGPL